MKSITKQEYDQLLSNDLVPASLKKKLINNTKEVPWVFVGTDFSGQENVNLSELLIPYDNGNLDNVINNGSKDDGTDLHSLNAKACGVSRGDAKAIFFGLT